MIERSRFADEEGISLVEMLISIVLLSIILGAMARSLTTALFSAQGQERQVQATAQLQESLEQINGVRWADAGLCRAAVTAHFGGTTYTHEDGTTEPLVLLDDSDETCTAPILVPARTVTRAGVDYTVETVLTWTDDPSDDVSGTDPNSPQDLKHALVSVEWEHQGSPRSVSNETYLAPNALEKPVRTQVEHSSGQSFTYLWTDTNLTKTDVYLRVFTVVPQSGITVTWARQDGSMVAPQPMTDVNGKQTEWRLLIPNGSPEFAINQLPNGETLFQFSATDAATATAQSFLDRGLFVIEEAGHTVTATTVPTSVRIKDGVACPFTVEVFVRGALTSDLVSATWTNGPTETALTAVGSNSTGTSFRATFTGQTGFASGLTTLTVTAVRVADAHPGELVVADIPVTDLDATQSC